jgi:predicted protein tyrosine phosphatase
MSIPSIHVAGLMQLPDLLDKFPQKLTVIRLRGTGDKDLPNRQLARAFTDVFCDDLTVEIGHGYITPTEDTAKAIWRAWEEAKASEARIVVINCHAGVARSPAAALGIMFIEALRQNPATAVDVAVGMLLKRSPICLPNPLLLRRMIELVLPKEEAEVRTQQLLKLVNEGQTIDLMFLKKPFA